jgi:hypothetical protein
VDQHALAERIAFEKIRDEKKKSRDQTDVDNNIHSINVFCYYSKIKISGIYIIYII